LPCGGVAMNAMLVARSSARVRLRNVLCSAAGNAGARVAPALRWTPFTGKRAVLDGEISASTEFTPEAIKQVLENCKLRFSYLLTTGELIDRAWRKSSARRLSPGCTAHGIRAARPRNRASGVALEPVFDRT